MNDSAEKVLLEKLTLCLVKRFTALYETRMFTKAVTVPFPEPVEFNPYPHTLFP
jgi:hypothetical protein